MSYNIHARLVWTVLLSRDDTHVSTTLNTKCIVFPKGQTSDYFTGLLQPKNLLRGLKRLWIYRYDIM